MRATRLHAHYDRNQIAFDEVANQYVRSDLFPPELMLLRRFRGRWHCLRVLDLGVGAGRTSYVFASIAKRYVGIDYAPRMIELCRKHVGESDDVSFRVGDIRHLTKLLNERFDLVICSFNSLDYVRPSERIDCVRQVSEVLLGGGTFFFSSHSLNMLPFRLVWPSPAELSSLRAVYQAAVKFKRSWRRWWVYRHFDTAAARTRGWAVLNDGAVQNRLETYYVDPSHQIQQLRDAHFTDIEIYDLKGTVVTKPEVAPDPYLHYIARR